jgi:hypothetical protein
MVSNNSALTCEYLFIAITRASEKGHIGVIEILLQDSRVDPSADNNYGNIELYSHLRIFIAIRMASEFGHIEVVKSLLQDSRVDPSADNNYGDK